MTINALPHQSAVVSLVQTKRQQPYFFLIGGFGCGKSFTDVIFLLYLVSEYRYCKEPVKFGIFGVTIKLLKQTVIADFCRFLEMLGVSFKNNSQEGTITVGNITLKETEHKVISDGEKVELTHKEFEMLKLFMQNPNMVFSRDKLMSEIWGMDYIGETRTVDMHIKTLRHKLRGAGGQIKTVIGVGYRLENEV